MASAVGARQLMCLPNEILAMILPLALASKNGADLKRLRLMNKQLAIFVEPYLFRWICLSMAGENFEAWKSIAQPSSRLRHHVKHVCIDCTTFIPDIGIWRYCKLLAQHLEKNCCNSHPRQDGKASQRDGNDDDDVDNDAAAVYTQADLLSDLTDSEGATRLLPGDRKLLQRGYQDYLLQAESQKQIRSSCSLYEALSEGLRSLPRVQAISLMTKWHVDTKATRERHEPDEIHMDSAGSNVNLPGPLARQHPPLRLPPQCIRSWSTDHDRPLLVENFREILRAVRKLHLDLRTLIGLGPNQSCLVSTPHLESLDSLGEIGLPIEAFARPERIEQTVGMNELVTGNSSALRHLRKLELSIAAPRWGAEDGDTGVADPSYLPHMLRWMPYIEDLVLRQHRHLGQENGVANLNEIFGMHEFIVHRSIINNPKDRPEFHYPCYGQDVLAVWNVPSFPRLRHLELSGFELNRGGLNSLLSRVASSLGTLKLHNTRLSPSDLWWKFFLNELRQIFCKRSPLLELSFTMPAPEFVALLLDYDVLPQKAHAERSSEERLRSGFQKIERFITSEAGKDTFRDWLAPLRAGDGTR